MPEAKNIATHKEPGASANFLLHVDLADHGMPGKYEQLWASRSTPTEFAIASIPFFPYGLALGDLVSTRGPEPPNLVVASVVRRSGHRTLRVGLSMYKTIPELHEHLHRELVHSGLCYEWHGAEYVAIDLPTEGAEASLLEYLQPLATSHKLVYEIVE